MDLPNVANNGNISNSTGKIDERMTGWVGPKWFVNAMDIFSEDPAKAIAAAVSKVANSVKDLFRRKQLNKNLPI